MNDPIAEIIANLERCDPLCGPVVRSAMHSLGLPPRSRGIDIGCGIGLSTIALAEETRPDGTVVGVDAAEGILEYARQRMRDRPIAERVSFRPGDMHDLPFDRNTFDWACSVDCVGYPAGDFAGILKEIARVVRPGGLIALLAWSSQQLLPGYTMLEARLNATCSAYTSYLRSQPPRSHFLRALHWFPQSCISKPTCSTFVGQIQAPLSPEIKGAVAALFDMLWAGSMANASEGDAEQYRALCRPDSPSFILNELEYAAHEDARFHLANGTTIAAASLADADRAPARCARTPASAPIGPSTTRRGWRRCGGRRRSSPTDRSSSSRSREGRGGSRIAVSSRGATLEVTREVASVTAPMSRVELVMNGEIRESVGVDPARAADSLRVAVRKSSWLALLVRGHYPDKPEIVAAHTSPVMAEVEGSSLEATADAYRRMRLVLESADRSLHNRMHRQGRYHEHLGPRDHPEHH